MDSLKSLLDAKKYDLVLKLTQGSADKNDLFYRIAAYIGLAQYENALYVIQDHQAILEANLVALIPAHIELLCVLQRFEQAQAILEYYSNLPYQSQAVEEILRKMPEVIKKEEEKDQAIYISEDKLSAHWSTGFIRKEPCWSMWSRSFPVRIG